MAPVQMLYVVWHHIVTILCDQVMQSSTCKVKGMSATAGDKADIPHTIIIYLTNVQQTFHIKIELREPALFFFW